MTDALKEHGQQYDEVMKLYDYADELALTIDDDLVASAKDQLALVEPVIVQLEESADVLTDEFIQFASGKAKRGSRSRVEKALRKIYTALDDYTLKLHGTLNKNVKAIHNIADGIILKVKEKLEEIILIFVHFTQLSLDRVMNKGELEEIKRNQQHVFFQLHNLSQQH